MTTPRPWDPATEPNPEQLADWLTVATRDELETFTATAIQNSRDAARCLQMQHEKRLHLGMTSCVGPHKPPADSEETQ